MIVRACEWGASPLKTYEKKEGNYISLDIITMVLA
jgi:hypothetical protein